MMMTGSWGWRCFTLWSNSRPELPGMRMSETSTCGQPVVSSSMASCARANVLNGMPSRVSAFSNTHRMDRSSSTTHTGFIYASGKRRRDGRHSLFWGVGSAAYPVLVQRQHDAKACSPRLAVDFDHAFVMMNERLRQSQPETASAVPPGHQRKEDFFPDSAGNARSVIGHLQF